MKKFIALLAPLALCLTFTAGLAEETDENLISAKGLLDFWYKNKNREKPTATAEDYTVTAQLMIDGVVYPVTWAVDLDTIQVQPAEDGKYTIVLDKANAAGKPVYGSEIEQVKLGCAAAEGLDYVALGRQTGLMAAKVLKGEAAASDIPYEIITEPSLYVNSKVLESFGITLPEELAARATEAE